jgi:hypothetical protein
MPHRGGFLLPFAEEGSSVTHDQRDGKTVVALAADGLDRGGADPRLGGKRDR